MVDVLVLVVEDDGAVPGVIDQMYGAVVAFAVDVLDNGPPPLPPFELEQLQTTIG